MRARLVVTLLLLVTTLTVVPSTVDAPAASAGNSPTHDLVMSATGATSYPDFDQSITRYGLRTTASTGDTVTVTATTSDPGGTIEINARPADSGVPFDVVDVEGGDEITVRIDDSGGTTTYGVVVLPVGFPILEAESSGSGPTEGHTFLTMGSFLGPGADAIIDHNAVPVWLSGVGENSAGDLKVQPDGRYSVGRTTTTPGRSGQAIVTLDEAFESTDSYETVGLVNTDFHDSILRPDGSRLLMAYEPGDGQLDSVIQDIDPAGQVVFEWNSKDHGLLADATINPSGDYAHINSLFEMADGDILASFRNTGQVLKIARTAHDGFAVGDVVWRLGGRNSDFTFVNDPHLGPCAQHHAQQLPNGNILIWDNGSQDSSANAQFGSMCVDPANPSGDTIDRPFSRAVEYDLDETAMTATLVWSHDQDGVFGAFAGSVTRFDNGNTLMGWTVQNPMATEVDDQGNEVWELRNLSGHFSYRVLRFPAPDGIDPTADFGPLPVTSYVGQDSPLVADYGCRDRGGSGVDTCTAELSSLAEAATPVETGDPIDTSQLGQQQLSVTATDNVGNTSTETRSIVVVPNHTFDDVPPWVDNAVDWLAANGYMSGYSDDTFRPGQAISRAQVANVLWRIGDEPGGLGDHGFTDVPPWVEDAVRWLKANSLIDGYPDGTFRPGEPISRAQMVRVLWRIAGSPTDAADHGLGDVPAWVDDAVDWAVANGYMTGYPDGTFRPDQDISRAQVANVLFRIISSVPPV